MMKIFRLAQAALLALTMGTAALAEELVASLDLGLVNSSDSITVSDGVLRVSATPQQQFQLLIEIDDPGITSPVYALKGMVRYDDVEGDGHLHLDNRFEGVGSFFTKSLAPSGPLQKISGTSDWRPFMLPFFANQGDASQGRELRPDALALGVHLPGGVVELSDLSLYQYASDENPLGAAAGFNGIGSAGLIAAFGGALVGIWGALVGGLASRGRARAFALGSASLLVAVGIATLAAGIFAVIDGQPYNVYYPLLLFGGILAAVAGILRGVLPRRYEAVELQKMQSLDA